MNSVASLTPARWLVGTLGCFVGAVSAGPPLSAQSTLIGARSCVAHGGASAAAPSHTITAYRLALQEGADFIEPDLQMTRDGVLVCTHDLSLERTTNAEEVFPNHARMVERRGVKSRAWPVADFTLEEIRQLDAGSWFDPKFAGEKVPTLQELIDLVRGKAGIYPETKDPDFYLARGTDIDQRLHEVLERNGLATRAGQRETPVLIQSSHRKSLEKLSALGAGNYSLIQLVWIDQWNDFLSDEGLDSVAEYA